MIIIILNPFLTRTGGCRVTATRRGREGGREERACGGVLRQIQQTALSLSVSLYSEDLICLVRGRLLLRKQPPAKQIRSSEHSLVCRPRICSFPWESFIRRRANKPASPFSLPLPLCSYYCAWLPRDLFNAMRSLGAVCVVSLVCRAFCFFS